MSAASRHGSAGHPWPREACTRGFVCPRSAYHGPAVSTPGFCSRDAPGWLRLPRVMRSRLGRQRRPPAPFRWRPLRLCESSPSAGRRDCRMLRLASRSMVMASVAAISAATSLREVAAESSLGPLWHMHPRYDPRLVREPASSVGMCCSYCSATKKYCTLYMVRLLLHTSISTLRYDSA